MHLSIASSASIPVPPVLGLSKAGPRKEPRVFPRHAPVPRLWRGRPFAAATSRTSLVTTRSRSLRRRRLPAEPTRWYRPRAQVPISASLSIFEHTAREIADDMGRDPSTGAQDIAHRAREMMELFRSWGAQAPSDEARARAIQKVLDLHREAHEYQARRS